MGGFVKICPYFIEQLLAPQFLPFQASHGLFLQIIEVKLVDEAPDVDARLRIVVIRNNPVGDGDNFDLVEIEFVHQSQHLVVAS